MFSFLTSALPVLLPLICILGVEWVFCRSLRHRDESIDVFEIGVFYSAVVLIYAVFPGIEFLSGGLTYSVLADYRLYRAQPSPRELAPIFWYYTLYLGCFVLSYRAYRGRRRSDTYAISGVNQKLLWLLLAGYLFTYLYFVLVRAFWGIRAPDSYIESYVAYKGLPLFWQQLTNHMVGIAFVLQLLLMAFLVGNYRKFRLYIFGWLVVEFTSVVVFGVGARTGLMILLLTFIITYHRSVKRLSMGMVGSLGVALLLLFIGLGLIRAWSASGDMAEFSLFGSSNEFDSLLANAYDLRELKMSGQTDEIFPRFYFADLMRVVPDQFMLLRQLNPSQWYVDTFYPAYAEQGGGFTFGAIAESIVGLGWVDVIWRGVLIGWIFGSLHRHFLSENRSFWHYAFYLWLTIFSYQTFRVTTFNLLPRGIWMILLWYSVKVLARLFRVGQSVDPHRTWDAPCSIQP